MFVSLDQLAPVGVDVGGIVGRLRHGAAHLVGARDRQLIETPVEPARIVEPHLHSVRSDGAGQLADQVAPAPLLIVLSMGILHPARPEREAVVVLRGEHDVARAHLLE